MPMKRSEAIERTHKILHNWLPIKLSKKDAEAIGKLYSTAKQVEKVVGKLKREIDSFGEYRDLSRSEDERFQTIKWMYDLLTKGE